MPPKPYTGFSMFSYRFQDQWLSISLCNWQGLYTRGYISGINCHFASKWDNSQACTKITLSQKNKWFLGKHKWTDNQAARH